MTVAPIFGMRLFGPQSPLPYPRLLLHAMFDFVRKIGFFMYGRGAFTRKRHLQLMEGPEGQYDFPVTKSDGNKLSVLITGANSGIGFASAKFLASLGAQVHLVCRNKERGENAIAEIKSSCPEAQVFLWQCDVSRPAEIKAMVASFAAKGYALDVLVNNAGVMLDKRSETEDGIETTFATNTLSTFYLTRQCLPLMKDSTHARVINIASGGGLPVPIARKYRGNYDWELRQKGVYNGVEAYAHTKRQQMVLAEYFRDVEGPNYPNVIFVSCHPKWAATEGLAKSMPSFHNKLRKSLLTTEEGADIINWLTTIDVERLESGEFYEGRGKGQKEGWWSASWVKGSDPEVPIFIDYCLSLLAKTVDEKSGEKNESESNSDSAAN